VIKMKKYILPILIFLLIFPVSGWATTYYAADDGSGTDCTIGSPCTLLYTVETKAGAGDTVYINNGTYALPEVIDVPDDVDIEGESEAGVIVTYDGMAGSGAMFSFQTGSTAATISNMTLDANDAAYRGILVRNRGNVTIHDVTINDGFVYGGILIEGTTRDTEACNGTYETGIEVYNITSNSASTGTYGAIGIGGTIGALLHDLDLTETDDAQTGIKFGGDWGCNKGLKIYDSTITAGSSDNGAADTGSFTIELWNTTDDSEIYGNTLNGEMNFDRASKGAGTYAVKIHDNLFTFTGQDTTGTAGISMDDDISYLQIYNNKFQYLSCGVSLYIGASDTDVMQYINIFNNVFWSVYDGDTSSRPIHAQDPEANGSTIQYFNVYGNIFYLHSTWNDYLLNFENIDNLNNINIKNNIIVNAETAVGKCSGGTGTKSTMNWEYNYYDNNGSNSFDNTCTMSSLTEANNISTLGAPMFTNTGTGDLTLKPGSPARHGATYIAGYTTALDPSATFGVGYNGLTMEDILSIGAYGVYRGAAGM